MKRLFILVLAIVLSLFVCSVAGAIEITSNDTGSFEITAGLSKTDVTSITIVASAAPTVEYTWSEGAWSAAITTPETTFTISTASSLTKKITAAWTTNNTVLSDYGLTVETPTTGAFDNAGVSLEPNASNNSATKVTLSKTDTDPTPATISAITADSDISIGSVVFTVADP